MIRSKRILESLTAAAMIVALSACAGGGGGGGDILGGDVSVPDDPQYAEDGTTMPNAPNGTEFPLLQMQAYYADSGGNISGVPGQYKASITPLADGTRLKVESLGLNVQFGDDDIDPSADPTDSVTYAKEVDGRLVVLKLYGALEGLDYMELGAWAVATDGPTATVGVGIGVGGYETLPDDMPTSGTATYEGRMVGVAVDNSTGDAYDLTGKATMIADFSTGGGITGSFTDTTATNVDTKDSWDWDDVSFTGSIVSNGFDGVTSVDVANGNPGGLDTGASGVVEGKFFGPVGGVPDEAGGVWTIRDPGATGSSGTVATGAFGVEVPD